MSEKIVTLRAQAFTAFGVEEIEAKILPNGLIGVYDDIAGYYTSCHSLSERDQARVRKMVNDNAAAE